MKKTITVRGVEIGVGVPKVCVPISGKTVVELLDEIVAARELADIIEWRADFFEELPEVEKFQVALRILRGALGETPLLFCYRTAAEGGNGALPANIYQRLCEEAAESGNVDLLDVEFSAGEKTCAEVLETLRRHGVVSLVSSHDFSGTPSAGEMVATLRGMQALGADIPKLAVLANSPADLLALLSATNEYNGRFATGPMTTMAMGDVGALSRISGGVFGADIAYGYVGKATAPGQLEAGKLKSILRILYGAG